MTAYITIIVLAGLLLLVAGLLLGEAGPTPAGFVVAIVAAAFGAAVLVNLTTPVSLEQLSFAQERCSSNAGLLEITNLSFVCANGAEFTYEGMTEMQDGK